MVLFVVSVACLDMLWLVLRFFFGFKRRDFLINNIEWCGFYPRTDATLLPWEKEYAKSGLFNAWIIQHGINTTGSHHAWGALSGVKPRRCASAWWVGSGSHRHQFRSSFVSWFFTTKSWSIGVVEEVYVCEGERWNLMTLLQTNKSVSIHQLHSF